MKIRLKLFAAIREIAGQDDMEVEVADGTTAGALWEKLQADFPKLSPYRNMVQVAVNQDVVERRTTLQADDEVAFLPPVSGG